MAGCDDDLNDAQDNLLDINGDGPGTAGSSLAQYGYCIGTNAVQSLINGLPIVKEIESAIEAGELEATEVVTMVTGSLALFGAVTGGAAATAIASITSVMPIVGVCVVVVVAVVEVLNSIGGGPQLWVPNPNATGDGILGCPSSVFVYNGVSLVGMRFEKINLSDYGGFVTNAMNWLNVPANAKAALTMTPAEFSAMHNIFIDSKQPAWLANAIVTCNGAGYGDDLSTALNIESAMSSYNTLASQSTPPPGAYELLRTVQLPAAAATVAAMPTYANYLTNNDGSLGGGNNANAPLMTMFPALRTDDMAAVFNAQDTTAANSWTVVIGEARQWADEQCPPPTPEAIMQRYNLPRSDACNVLAAWVPPNGCSTQTAPPCTITASTIIGYPGGGSTIAPGTTVTNPITAPVPLTRSSTASKVVLGAAAVGTGVVLWHVLVGGYTLTSVGSAVVGGTKTAYKTTKGWIDS